MDMKNPHTVAGAGAPFLNLAAEAGTHNTVENDGASRRKIADLALGCQTAQLRIEALAQSIVCTVDNELGLGQSEEIRGALGRIYHLADLIGSEAGRARQVSESIELIETGFVR